MQKVGDLKTCFRCKETKELATFAKNASKPDGLQDHCRSCQKARYEENNVEKVAKTAYFEAKKLLCGPKEKVCSKCHGIAPKTEFHVDRYKADGLESRCKTCVRTRQKIYWWSSDLRFSAAETARGKYQTDPTMRSKRSIQAIKLKYGLTEEVFNALLVFQGGVCSVCGSETSKGKSERFHVDHDHSCCGGMNTCGKCIRGLLCAACNVQLGAYEAVLKNPRALEYLENPTYKQFLVATMGSELGTDGGTAPLSDLTASVEA